MMSQVVPFRPEHLPQLRALINCHLNLERAWGYEP
jgi:hypothetical protein